MTPKAGIALGCLFGIVAWYYGRNYLLSRNTDGAGTSQLPPVKDSVSLPVLKRIDPVKVGHLRDVHIMDGRVHNMRTLSLRPLLFEIQDFLTHEECDILIELARGQGMDHSLTVGETPTEDENGTIEGDTSSSSRIKVPDSDPVETFYNVDLNEDGVIDMAEVTHGLNVLGSVQLTAEDTEKIVSELGLDPNNDGFVSYEEFMALAQANKLEDIIVYLDQVKDATPTKRTRNSFGTFLDSDSQKDHEALFQAIKLRIQKVSGLPMPLIQTSEALQVLQYSVKQHYHCHYDTEVDDDRPGAPCCHHQMVEETPEFDECRPCRFMTFFYYLHEPDEGGETAFPIADNETIAPELINTVESYRCDLSSHCQKANVVYKPKKGAAIFWYNHLVDQESGWLGPRDNMSYHGGCDVLKGTKWAANNWLNAGEDRRKDMAMWKMYDVIETLHQFNEFEEAYPEESMAEQSANEQSAGPGTVTESEANGETHIQREEGEDLRKDGLTGQQDNRQDKPGVH